ncbi:MAG TPA: SrtB family sortase [Clostridiales bacterium]|nr:SrtB family sortase [Clostridiales bacterium]
MIRFSPTLTPTPTFTPTPTLAPTPTPTPVDDGIRPSDRTIDFEALFERNPDIIGWLSVPGTEIDYPLLKSADNAEYLEYDVDGDENVAGAIFMDMGNDSGFSDRNTVIYGHNMKNGTMFAGLHQFEDKEFFYKNREIKLYTPAGMRTYEVIAAYPVSNRNILYGMDYADDDVWEAYVEDIYGNKDRSANLLKKQIGEHDQIVSLSTCVRGESKQRYLVQGLLRRDSD